MASPPVLKRVREHLANDIYGLLNIVEDQDFKNVFGQLQGEKSKRLDKSFLTAAEKSDLIYHKQFYAFAEFPLSDFYGSELLLDEVLRHLKVIKPLNSYFNNAF